MNSNEIQERQNKEIALKVQYAARVCFNSAEKNNHFAWIACLVSAFSVFLPNSWPMYIINGIPCVADIFAFVFSLITSRQVNWASKLRKFFDSYVLDIQPNQFSETELRGIREQTEKIYITTVFILILVGSILVVLLPNNSILNILLCSAGILIKICERVIENWRYFRISRLIEGAQQAIEVHPTAEGVKKLQNLIDERRSINVLEFGYFHKKLANKLSGLYKNISL